MCGSESPGGFMRYENEDGRNKSDVGGSSESFLKAPRVTRQVYAETSIISVTGFIASWRRSAPIPRFSGSTSIYFLSFLYTQSAFSTLSRGLLSYVWCLHSASGSALTLHISRRPSLARLFWVRAFRIYLAADG